MQVATRAHRNFGICRQFIPLVEMGIDKNNHRHVAYHKPEFRYGKYIFFYKIFFAFLNFSRKNIFEQEVDIQMSVHIKFKRSQVADGQVILYRFSEIERENTFQADVEIAFFPNTLIFRE